MAGSVHTQAYTDFLKALIGARKSVGLSQAQLAAKLRKPPSFVGKYELGERRLDVVELLVILNALEIDLEYFITKAELTAPDHL